MKPYPALLAELLSKELYSLRQQKSLTQEAMAEQLRISSRAYSDLERGLSLIHIYPIFPYHGERRQRIILSKATY